MSRMTLEMRSPGRQKGAATAEDSYRDSDDSSISNESAPASSESDDARVMAQHIAAHLQVLMRLVVRFANLINAGEDFGDDEGTESVDIDSNHTPTSISDIGKFSGFSLSGSFDDDFLPDADNTLPVPLDTLRQHVTLGPDGDSNSGQVREWVAMLKTEQAGSEIGKG